MYDEIAIEFLVDFGYIHRIYVDFYSSSSDWREQQNLLFLPPSQQSVMMLLVTLTVIHWTTNFGPIVLISLEPVSRGFQKWGGKASRNPVLQK